MSRVSHLYVHVPSGVPDRARAIAALRRELELRGSSEALDRPLETVAVGGGAASELGAEVMEMLRRTIGPERLTGVLEWTVEGTPGDIDGALARAWGDAGVTRLSVDAGSLRGEALEWMGRGYGPKAVRQALAAASVLPTWGVDLFYGLPLTVEPDPLESVKIAVDLGVPHVSLYEWTGRDGADDDLKADQYLALGERLRTSGYEAYEMMAFARPGHASRHALAVLRGAPFLALGPGAHGCAGDRRSWNLREWPVYLTTVERDRMPEGGEERPGVEARRLETLWAGLRLREGLLRSRLGPASSRLGDRWVGWGLAYADVERVRLTPEGWLRLDELAVELARTEASIAEPLPGRGR